MEYTTLIVLLGTYLLSCFTTIWVFGGIFLDRGPLMLIMGIVYTTFVWFISFSTVAVVSYIIQGGPAFLVSVFGF